MHDFISAVANPQGSARKFQFIGGELCLDFTNTVGGRRGATAREYLNSYGDFVSWCRQAGLLDDSGVEALARGAARRPRDSVTALSRAIALRETLYRVFDALVLKAQPNPFDLDHLNLELSAHLGRLRGVTGNPGEGGKGKPPRVRERSGKNECKPPSRGSIGCLASKFWPRQRRRLSCSRAHPLFLFPAGAEPEQEEVLLRFDRGELQGA